LRNAAELGVQSERWLLLAGESRSQLIAASRDNNSGQPYPRYAADSSAFGPDAVVPELAGINRVPPVACDGARNSLQAHASGLKGCSLRKTDDVLT
jgi:hypothetical protein